MADSHQFLTEIIMNTIYLNFPVVSALLFFGIFLSGCAASNNPKDPLESMNRSVFAFNEKVDENILKPVAKAYSYAAPDPIQKMISNFYSNLDDIVVIFNDILQLKFREAGSDSARFLINTTLGFAGIIDYGTDYGFPKRNEDFGQTLGYYGVGSGPYIVIPIFGGRTLRDAGGGLVDIATNPIFYTGFFVAPWIAPTIGAARAVDTRAQLIEQGEIIDEAALDKYEFIRDAYLQRRRSLIFDGNPPRSMDDDLEGPGQDSSAPAKERSIVVEYIEQEEEGSENQDKFTDDTAVEPATP